MHPRAYRGVLSMSKHVLRRSLTAALVLGASAAAIAPATAAAQAPVNLVTNGSFEQPDFGQRGVFGLDVLPGWTSTRGCGYEVWGRGFIVPAHDGNQLLELDRNGGCVDGMHQDVALVVGGSYRISFRFRARPDASAFHTNAIRVKVGGRQLERQSSDSGQWALVSGDFTATTTGSRVTVEDFGTDDGVGSLIDDVVLIRLDDLDGDGVVNVEDAFPNDPAEQTDTDGDGQGNNADRDDDGDGVADADDAFPLDATESVDTDRDGQGDRADADDDGDGVLDADDAFPLDATESVDTDGDGQGNRADTDDDNDGVLDAGDAFPLDATETVDTDGDGQGDNADTDADADGTPDSGDACGTTPGRAQNGCPLPTTADECKKDGWRNYGTTYRNQGGCVSDVQARTKA
jgi:hypothetical protein